MLDTHFAGDEARIESLLRFSMVPCATEPEGLGAPPQCPEGVPNGTEVEVFPVAYCEGVYVPSDQVQDIVEQLAAPGTDIVAVYRFGDPSPETFLHGNFVVVAALSDAPAPQNAGGVWIGDGGITGLHRGCGQTPEQFAEFWGLTEKVDLGAEPTEQAPSLPPAGTGREAGGVTGWLIASAVLGALGAGASAFALARRRR